MAANEQTRLREGQPEPVEVSESGASARILLRGAWTTENAAALDPKVANLDAGGAAEVLFDLAEIDEMDTSGAWLILRTVEALQGRGATVELASVDARFRGLLDTVAEAVMVAPEPPQRASPLVALLVRIGRATLGVMDEARNLLEFLGAVVVALLRAAASPRRVRFPALVAHMEATGLNALPIVGLLSFLIGVVLAYQGADQLARFGAEIYTVNLVGVGVLREMGVLLTAIIVAGRSGSAFTAQIGTMKVNQEIDALSTLGLDPLFVLVLPRVLGLMLVMPLLVFYADVLGLVGGASMATLALDISFSQFMTQMHNAVPIDHFWVGLVKAPLFAFVIAVVGCYEGLQVSQSAESVGRMTTKSVVEGVFLIIVLDAFLSIFFSMIGV